MLRLFKRKLLKYRHVFKPALIVGFFLAVIILSIQILSPYYQIAKANNLSLPFIFNLFFDKKPNLKESKNRTNMIILGISGGDHAGSDLTDTMIFMSVDFTKNDVVTLSIPRDIWLPSLRDKINTAYHYGETKKQGGGIILAKAAIEEALGLPVQYAWIVDFSGFNKIIDLIGGIDINIEKGFEDKLFPIAGKENDECGGDKTFACRYEDVRFESGWQHMDGDRALKYVRSRHAEGDEGTDFARGRRQQQVITAIKDKILKTSLWEKPSLLKQMFEVYKNTTKTDMDWSEKISFAKYYMSLPNKESRSLVLDMADEKKKKAGFLINPPSVEYKGAWVLIPRTENFDEIHEYISCQLEDPACKIVP